MNIIVPIALGLGLLATIYIIVHDVNDYRVRHCQRREQDAKLQLQMIELLIGQYMAMTIDVPGDTLAERLRLLILSYNLNHSEYKDS